MNGGLSNIPPMALMNFLRILLIHLKDFRWRSAKLADNIPVINANEWPQIFSHCTEQEFDALVKLTWDPISAMPNQATGRQTPVQEYYQNLNNSFQERVRRTVGNHWINPISTQNQIVYTPHPRLQRPPGPPLITRLPYS